MNYCIPSGVAACLIGGVTLHAFAGIGAGEANLNRCYDLASRPASAQAWRKCKRLIIDEISMVDGQFFEVRQSNFSLVNGTYIFDTVLIDKSSDSINRKLKRWLDSYDATINHSVAFN